MCCCFCICQKRGEGLAVDHVRERVRRIKPLCVRDLRFLFLLLVRCGRCSLKTTLVIGYGCIQPGHV